MNYSPKEGQYDVVPEYHKYLTFLKKVYRHEFRTNGFRRVSTPIIEEKTFLQESGVYQSPILEHEDFDIRQEASSGIFRLYMNNEMSEQIQPVYLYYIDRFFKKTKNNFKEENIIGGEVIGVDDPILDAIMISMNYKIFNNIGLQDKFTLKINSTGIAKEKAKFEEELKNFYEPKKNVLSEDSKQLLETNPSSILASTDEDDIILNENAPKMVPKFLKKYSKAHFNSFVEYLDILEIPYEIDNSLVAENSAQTHSIWKFISKIDGRILSQGSRKNALSTNLGLKKEIPSSGFSTNMDQLIEFLQEQEIDIKDKDEIHLFITQLGDEAKKVILPLSIEARKRGLNTVVALGTPSMKEQMLKAQKSGAAYVVMVGIMEARSGVFQVRNQADGTQQEVKKEELIDYIIQKIGEENLDFYAPVKDLLHN
ncbi:ATP phosphoribosyltransferase regulatory subunit [Candidatus Gracilibacteria bacterium]|nr:ATP phosphoribosyltransferase regulatory subunit [Candidatus Gracilibacteria bacterium]